MSKLNSSPNSSLPKKPGNNSNLNNYIFTYTEAAALAREDIQYRRDNPAIGVPFDAFGFGRSVAPAWPGSLVLTVGRPGHMKTGTLCILADKREQTLRALGEDRQILMVTAETTIEQLMHNFIASSTGISKTEIAWGKLTDDQMKQVDNFALVEAARGIWFYGNSSRLAAKQYIKPAPMTPQTIANAIDAVANWQKGKLNVIDLVTVDYFQMLEPNLYDPEARVRYENVMRDLKRIALTLPGPLFMACQAKQEVDKRDDPLPLQNDIEQTNEGHKDADIIVSTIIPSRYKEKLSPGNIYHDITLSSDYYQQLMLFSLRKHKSSGFPQDHWVFADFATNRMTNLKPFAPIELNQ